jgi:type I restriction enzyme S subunit
MNEAETRAELTETKKVEAIYTQKIADLDEMKKSVLQKAFSGQLTNVN